VQNAVYFQLNIFRLLKSQSSAKLKRARALSREFTEEPVKKIYFPNFAKVSFIYLQLYLLITSHIPKRVNKVLQRARTQATFLRCVDI